MVAALRNPSRQKRRIRIISQALSLFCKGAQRDGNDQRRATADATSQIPWQDRALRSAVKTLLPTARGAAQGRAGQDKTANTYVIKIAIDLQNTVSVGRWSGCPSDHAAEPLRDFRSNLATRPRSVGATCRMLQRVAKNRLAPKLRRCIHD